MEVEHQAAGQVAGSQTRPKSPGPAVAGLDAGWAVNTAENEAALAGVKVAGFSGTMEIERLSCAADQAAKIQARPGSPTPAAAGIDADSAALRVPESSMCGTPDPYEEMNMDSVTQCVGALREAAAVNFPECRGPELGASAAWNPMRAAESTSDGENESAYAKTQGSQSGLTWRPRHLEKGRLTSQTNAERLVGWLVPPGQNRRASRRRSSTPALSASLLTHGQTW